MSNLPPPWRPIGEKEGMEFLGFMIFLKLLPAILIALVIMGVVVGVVGVIKGTVNLFGTNVNIGAFGYCPPNYGCLKAVRVSGQNGMSFRAVSNDGRWVAVSGWREGFGSNFVVLDKNNQYRPALEFFISSKVNGVLGVQNQDLVAFSHDDRYLALAYTADVGSWVEVWDLVDKARVRILELGPCGIGQLAFLPDGRLLGNSCGLHLWSAQGAEHKQTLNMQYTSFVMGASGRLGLFDAENRVSIVDPDQLDSVRLTVTPQMIAEGRLYEFRRAAISPDGHWLALAEYTRANDREQEAIWVEAWDLSNGQRMNRVKVEVEPLDSGSPMFFSQEDPSWLYIPSYDTFQVYNMQTSQVERLFRFKRWPHRVAMYFDGQDILVTDDTDNGYKDRGRLLFYSPQTQMAKRGPQLDDSTVPRTATPAPSPNMGREATRIAAPTSTVAVPLATITPAALLPGCTAPLKVYWSAKRGDVWETATAVGESAARDAGYQFVRIEGHVFANQEPGTIPLKLYWNERREDNLVAATPAGEQSALTAGYKFIRVEGYVYPVQAHGTLPLKLFWKEQQEDNLATATAEGEQVALSSGYQFVRIEGYVCP